MEQTENKVDISSRDKALARLKEKYPDKAFDSDDDVFGQISDDYDNYDKRLGDYENQEKTLSDMFSSDPKSAALLASWSKGSDPAVELVKLFGTDIKDAIDDPEKMAAIEEANKEYVDRISKAKELDEKYKSNLEESLKLLSKYQEENGLTDDQVDEAMELLVRIAQEAIIGTFSPESIDMAMKAINHDADVESANMEGEVRGKNAKIEEKLRKKSAGDGTATLDGKNSGGAKPAQKSLGALDKYGDNYKSIWDESNIKRTKIKQ